MTDDQLPDDRLTRIAPNTFAVGSVNPFRPPESERKTKCSTCCGRFEATYTEAGRPHKTCATCRAKERQRASIVGSERRRVATAAEHERRRMAALTCCPAAEAQLLREVIAFFDSRESPQFAEYLSLIIAPSWLAPCCAGRVSLLSRELRAEFTGRRNNVLFRSWLTRAIAFAEFRAQSTTRGSNG